MKTFIILIGLVLSVAVGQAQKVTALEEVKIASSALNAKIIKNGDYYIYTLPIKKVHQSKFANDPIGFLNENFDIQRLIAFVDEKYDSYEVTLKSATGYMVANYDGDGKLLTTRQNFKNKLLPYHVRLDVFKSNEGWTMTKNQYIAHTKGVILDKAMYKITLKNGNKKRNVKVDATYKNNTVIASI